jgi:excisionase family DNA binding protein
MTKSKQKTHLTPNEVAKLLMVNPVTVRQWAARGLLRSLSTPGGHRRFLLRDVEEFARSRGTKPIDAGNGRPERILIVDDDAQVRGFVAELLRVRAPEVATESASDGFDAGAKVEAFRPHALVLDLRMPGMDGFEVCGQDRRCVTSASSPSPVSTRRRTWIAFWKRAPMRACPSPSIPTDCSSRWD